MTKVYLGQKVRVIRAEHKTQLEGQVLYLDDIVENAHMGCYFVDGDPNGDGDTANENDDYGWVEKIQAVEGDAIDRERYFDDKGFRKEFVRADVLPAELKPYDVMADAEAAPDLINHPPHYTQIAGVECIQVTEHFNFNRGNAIKYIWRAGEKGSEIDDLRKAVWYLNREIERVSA